MEAGFRAWALKLDYFDDDNLYNQVIGVWDGVTTTLPSRQDVLSPGGMLMLKVHAGFTENCCFSAALGLRMLIPATTLFFLPILYEEL